MKHFFLLALLTIIVSSQYQPLSCFFTQKITLWQNTSNDKTTVPGGYNFTFAWDRPIINIYSYFLSIQGFKYQGANRFLSYDASIRAPTAAQCFINFNPVNSQIISITFRVTVISVQCSAGIQLLSKGMTQYQLVYNFVVFNQSPRLMATFGSIDEQYAVFNSNQFVFNNTADFKIYVYTSALQINNIPSNNYQHIYVYFNRTQPLNTNFTVTLRSWNIYCNNLTTIKLGIIILSLKTFLPTFSYFVQITIMVGASNSFVNNFGIPVQFTSQNNYTSMCIYGNNRMFHYMPETIGQFRLMHAGNDVTGIFLDKVDYLHFGTFCIMQCSQGYANSYASSTYLCTLMPQFVTNCLSYDLVGNCLVCKDNYLLVSPYYCQRCGGSGTLVQGGCTTVTGCTAVTKTTPSIYPTTCTACNGPQFYVDSNNQCSCLTGWIITGLCTSNYGCLTTKRFNTKVICSACDTNNKFILKNNTCLCSVGYSLDVLHVCQIVCGDGVVLSEQVCDDGNLIDGDGCNSQCKMQPFYICLNGSLTNPSQCFYNSVKMFITYVSAQKIQGQNSGIFTFKMQPTIILLNKMNMLSYFIFHCDSTYSVSQWIFSKGIIKMYVDYSQDLQAKDGEVIFVFDPALVRHGNITISFHIQSINSKLVVIGSQDQIQMIANLFDLLAWAVLIVFLVSSLFHKMIGVQTIHTFQIIYFIHLSNKTISEPYTKFKSLTLLLANFNYRQNKLQNLNIFQTSKKVHFQYLNAQKTIIILFIIIISCIVLILILSLLKNKYQKLQTVRLFIYHNWLFTFSVGFSIVICLMELTFSTMNEQANGLPIAVNISLLFSLNLITYLIGFHQWIYSFSQRSYAKGVYVSMAHCSKMYIPCYLIFIIIHINLLVLTYLSVFKFYCESVIALTLIMMIWQVIQAPYQRFIHNLGIFLNQVIILCFAVWSKMREYFPQLTAQNYQNSIILTFICLLSFSLAFASLRVIFVISDNYCKKTVQKKKEKKNFYIPETNQTPDDIDLYLRKMNIINPYSLQKIKGEQILSCWKFQNKNRLAAGGFSLFHRDDLEKQQKLLNENYKDKFSADIFQKQYFQRRKFKNLEESRIVLE